jgi:hypothetical protein
MRRWTDVLGRVRPAVGLSSASRRTASQTRIFRDVVGLYLQPAGKAVVLCVDEKSQALERTAPIQPIRPGLPERATHDYVRHGPPRCSPR